MPRLYAGAQALGLTLTPTQLEQFEHFAHELVAWNEKFNLTAITTYDDIQTKHFLDCLIGVQLLAEEWSSPPLIDRALRCLDVGTGAGFPGVPLQIALPHSQWTLMDGTGKKIVFLRQLVAKLGLSNATLLQGRAEELGRQPALRAQFDVVAARAVAPLNTLVEYLLPFVRPAGLAMIYKGPSAPQEFIEARKAIEILGGDPVRLAPVQVPFLGEKRFLLLIKKVRPTPNLYPRSQGLSRKKPLQ
jgi:16S rRNA (guanine527-N7)-methyltransferase